MTIRRIASGALTLTLGACDPVFYCGERLIDACRKAEDLSAFVGTEVAASNPVGNAVVGEGGAIHRQGKLSISVRTNMTTRSAPLMGRPVLRSDGVAGSTMFDTREDLAASFRADAAVGAFRGFRTHGTRVGGLDLLGSVSRIPAFGSEDLRVKPEGLLGFGIGLRLGLIQETHTLPAVSATAAYHGAPRFSAKTGPFPLADGGAVSISLDTIDVSTSTIRLAASKRFGRLGLTGGFGKDSYHVRSEYRVTSADYELDSGPQTTSMDLGQSNAFGGVSLALGAATLGAEAGTVFGGRQPALMNTFSDRRLDRSRSYFTLGVRMAAGRTFDRGQ